MKKKRENGFTVLELLIAMTITLGIVGIAVVGLGRTLGTKNRESRRTDALTSAQAALNVMSREIGNSGYGLNDSTTNIHNNGIVLADSSVNKLRIRSNMINTNSTASDLGEDVTYYYDVNTQSIARYDPVQSPKTSYIINRISSVNFQYYDYTGSSSTPTVSSTPTANTSRIRVTLTVQLDPVQGQPDNQTVKLASDVTLRNSDYMINQY
jgi:type II secretory pathway pseudopilin PulG